MNATWSERYPSERAPDPDIDFEWHDDKPEEHTDRFVTTEAGDLDCVGRTLRQGT